MRILGVDPGSVTTGYGVVDHVRGTLALVEQGSIRCAKTADLAPRLLIIHRELSEVIHRTRPEVVAVETPFAGKNVKSLVQLSHARGVVLLAAAAYGLEIVEYAPRAVKSAVVGYGAAEKEQVSRMVRLLLPGAAELKIGADASDALAVAICHAHSAKMAAVARGAARSTR
jgi:crossover junction endodeoxyribonuclease RuvC